MGYEAVTREAEDRLLEQAPKLAARVRGFTDQELHEHIDFVRLAINYAAEAERILAERKQEQQP